MLIGSANTTPDFRYPKDVLKSAMNQLERGNKNQDFQKIIDATIKISLAKSMITNDNAQEIIDNIDSLAYQTNDMGAKSLMFTLEATVLKAYFDQYSYKLYGRDAIVGDAPKEIENWTKQNFLDRTVQLANIIFSNRTELANIPIQDYKSVLVMGKDVEFTPSLYDFMAHEFIDLIQSYDYTPAIPFFRICNFTLFLSNHPKFVSDTDETIHLLFKSLLEINKSNPAAFIYTEMQRLDFEGENSHINYLTEKAQKYEALNALYEEYADSKYSVAVVNEMVKLDESLKTYELAKSVLQKYPKYGNNADTQNFVQRFEQRNIICRLPGIYPSGQSLNIKLESKNATNATVTAYRLPATFEWSRYSLNTKEVKKFKKATSCTYTLQPKFGEFTSTEVEFPALEIGKYIFVTSFVDKDGKRIEPEVVYHNNILCVTDINCFKIRINKGNRIYVLGAKTSEPIENADIHFKSNQKKMQLTTNKEGYVVCPAEEYLSDFIVKVGKDSISKEYINLHQSRNYNYSRDVAVVYTDRGLYRPGETVKFATVVYNNDSETPHCWDSMKIKAILLNANQEFVEELKLKTDSYGRADSSFVIPTQGLTGNYSIRIENEYQRILGSKSVTVSEYKAPTFYVKIDTEASNLTSQDNAVVKGNARSFSDFPIANAELTYTLTQARFFPFSNNDDFSDKGFATTDEQGNWEIKIAPELFKGKKNLILDLEVSVTSATGETQSAQELLSIGEVKYIDIQEQQLKIEADKKALLPFSVLNAKREEVETDCEYILTDKEKNIIAKGSVSSKDKAIDLSSVPSGEYTLQLSLNKEDEHSADMKVIIYRKADKIPPIDTPIWVTEDKIKCDIEGNFTLAWGSAFDTHIYYVIYNNEEIMDEGWLASSKGMHTHSLKAQFSDKENAHIQLYGWKDFKCVEEDLQLIVPTPKEILQLKVESFRDKITPNQNETWKIKLCDQTGKPYEGAMIATLYDASLDEIVRNYFQTLSLHHKEYLIDFYQITDWNQFTTHTATLFDEKHSNSFIEPHFNTYDERFFCENRRFARLGNCAVMRSSNKLYSVGSAMDQTIECDGMIEEKAEVEMSAPTEESPRPKVVVLRDPTIKTAFFMPQLVTDEDAIFTLEFEVPNRNTQWHLLTIAYTDKLQNCKFEKLITANKPLMVQPNLPRFLRNGDKATLKSSVMNNQDEAISATVEIEIFNTTDQTILYKQEKALTLQAKSSETVEINIDTPQYLTEIGFRIVAQNDEASDGEQSVIKILPATEKVIEAKPFYINEAFAEIEMPKFNQSGKIAFEYCDNPVWYCVTSLPSVMSDSETACAYINNYYSTVMADRIVKSNEQIKQAIQYFAEHPVKSNLEKNQDLKLTDVNSTTWVQEIKQENQLLQNIGELIDSATIATRKAELIKNLQNLQNDDGGFLWFNRCTSSEYITTEVLQRLGELNEIGYLDQNKDLNNMIVNAISYMDSSMIKEINMAGDPEFIYLSYADYIYVRSLFPNIPMDKSVKKIKDKVLKRLSKTWGKFSIRQKAETAVTLANYGEKKTAKKILESIMQFSRLSETVGRYWDVESYNKIGIAVSALKAAYKIDPQRPEIEEIRKWILMTKETQDWNNVSSKCDAIYSILATGKNLLHANTVPPVIKIGDLTLTTEKDDNYFGYIKCELPTSLLNSHSITVSRSGDAPSWGAVYCQYNAPMDEIEKYRQEDFKVEKEFYRYNADNLLESVNEQDIKTGDKIQVRLNIKTNRDLDYVTIVDQRAACFEPVSQISFYDYCDEAFYYKETRDEKTNFFIDRLRKGNYLLHYDVHVNNAGEYSSGTTAAQCLYAPQITGHSAGRMIKTK